MLEQPNPDEAQIAALKERYFRKVIAYPEGAIVHFGDCWYYACQICSCGLHADLEWLPDDAAEKLYPKFMDEHIISLERRAQLFDLPIPVPRVVTPEEEKAMMDELNKIFKRISDPEKEKKQ